MPTKKFAYTIAPHGQPDDGLFYWTACLVKLAPAVPGQPISDVGSQEVLVPFAQGTDDNRDYCIERAQEAIDRYVLNPVLRVYVEKEVPDAESE
jgi:hypothetical protein